MPTEDDLNPAKRYEPIDEHMPSTASNAQAAAPGASASALHDFFAEHERREVESQLLWNVVNEFSAGATFTAQHAIGCADAVCLAAGQKMLDELVNLGALGRADGAYRVVDRAFIEEAIKVTRQGGRLGDVARQREHSQVQSGSIGVTQPSGAVDWVSTRCYICVLV